MTPASSISIDDQTKKDAMMQVLYQRLAKQEDVNLDDIVTMIDKELQQTK